MYGHDPAHTGYNPHEATLSTTNVDQLVPRWQSADLGMGELPTSGAPSVSNGKVYVGSSVTTGDNFFAFDAETGIPAWSANIGYQKSCTDVGIGATSAISGSLLVVGGGDEAYYALDAGTGKQLWRNVMDVGPSGFAWSSPLLANGRAYVGMASSCDEPAVRGELRAISLDGNEVVSHYFVPSDQEGACVWNSPALSPDGSTLVVATGEDYGGYNGPYNRALISLDPNSLDIIQTHSQGNLDKDEDFGTSPIIFHDNLGRELVGANHKNGTFYTYVLNNLDAGSVWSRPVGIRIGIVPAYDPTFGNGGTLFIMGSNSRLYAVNPATGNNRWPDVEANGRGNMAVANGLIFLNDNGTLRILDETNGQTLRTVIPDNAGHSNSGVAVAHGFVYWLSGSRLNAWSLPVGIAPSPQPRSTPTQTALPTIAIPGSMTRFFPETRMSVSGLLLDYWTENGGLAQQGYPISGLMSEISELNDRTYTVQYFERAVFEYHPENQPPYNVLLSQLGTFQYKKKYPNGAPGQKSGEGPGELLFPETGKRLGGRFLEYWQAHGGLAQQGYPISEEFEEKSDLDGMTYTVQYFEKAVFEHHPENSPPYDVLLSQLGMFRHIERYTTKQK